MSEAAVSRANAAAPSFDLFRCIQCGTRLLTASGLQHHIDLAHKPRPKPARQIISAVSGKVVPIASIGVISGISASLMAKCQVQGNACYWCGKPFRFNAGREDDLAPTREHATPKSLGGTKILAIVHRRCNGIRGIINADAFRRLMDGMAVTREEMWPHLFGGED